MKKHQLFISISDEKYQKLKKIAPNYSVVLKPLIYAYIDKLWAINEKEENQRNKYLKK